MTKTKTCIIKNFYFFLTLSLAALLSTTLWSAQRKSDQAAPDHVIVEIKKADIRSAPNPTAIISEIAFKGEIFKVLHELPEWYIIELSSGKVGYLAKKYARPKILDSSKKARVLISKPAAANKEVAESYVLIISSGSYIRTIPRVNGKIVAKAKTDNAFKLSKKISAAWYEIALANGRRCYIPASISKIITPAELAQFKAQRKAAAVPKAVPKPKSKPQPQPQPQPKPQPEPIAAPEPQPALQPSYAVAMKNDIILRQEPDISAKIMVTAKQGDHYKLLSQEGAWCTVSLPDDRQAYVLSKVVRIVNESDLPAAVSEATKAAKQIKLKTVSVTDKSAKLRAKAGDSAKVISTASQGEIFKLVWIYKGWYEVLTSSGTAFISDKSAKLITDEESEAEAAAAAVGGPEPSVPPVPAQPEEKPTPTEKPAEHDEDTWLKDKYVLVTTNMVNLRESANIKSRILARANAGKTYKLLARHNEWYEIFFPPDQNAFVAVTLTMILAEADVLAGPKKWEEIKKERQAAELKAKQLRTAEALAKRQESARLAAEAKVREEAERKLRLEQKAAAEKARKEAALKAKLENERKIKEESERRAKEAAELKAKQEAEAKAREQEWLKDKYMLITVKKAVLQKEPNIKGKIIGTVDIDDSYKLVSRRKDWYEINFSTGTAFINHNLGIILSETALAEHKQKAAAEKARKEAALKAKLENERKIKEESERRAKEAAELKAKQEAEAKAREQEWLKDKYVVINKKNINLRKAPSRTSPVIAQTKAGESFKLVSRTKAWYEISMSSGNAFVASTLAEVLSDKELEARRSFEKAAAEEKADQLREAKELKEQQEAEAKAKDEAWCKDKYAVIMGTNANLRAEPSLKGKVLANAKKEDFFKLIARGKNWYEIFLPPDQNAFISIGLVDILTEGEVESRIRKEREPILRKQREAEEKALKLRAAEELKARQEAELKVKLENEKKLKEESEAKAKAAAELKAKEEAELKAKEIEWLKDKYILVKKQTNFHPAPNKKAAASGTAIPDASYKIVTRTNEWYGVDTSSGTAFIPIDRVKLMTEQELTAYRQQQELLRQEKLKKEAEEKTRKEAELKVRMEAERKAKEEMELKTRLAEEQKARKEAEAKAKIESLVQDKYILIQADNANLRSAPKKSSPIITRVKSGEYFKLIWIEEDEDNSQWYQINVPSGKQNIKAYIHSSLAQPVTKADLDKILQRSTPEAPSQESVRPAKTTAEKPTQEQLTATETGWLKDKYVLITINNTNLRQSASIKAAVIDKAKISSTYKLIARAKDWYEINISSGTAFVNAGVTKIITETEMSARREQQEKERELHAAAELKERQEAEELKARQEVERKDSLEAEQKAREEKLRLEAEAKAQREAERLAKEEAARKAKELRAAAELKERQEAEQKKREAAELKAKQEAEAKAKKAAELKARQEEKARQEAEVRAIEQEWIKDKYAVITINNTNLRQAPSKTASIVTKTNAGEFFKLKARGKEWYELLISPDQTAFVFASLVQVMSETEVQAKAEAERQAREEKLRLEAEAKARREAERLAKEEADRKAKERREAAELKARQEAEHKKREAAELKAKQEAETKALEEEWLKDKYVVVQYKDTNVRKAPSKNAEIVQKAQSGQDFKIVSRGKEWYEIAFAAGTAYIHNTVVKVFLGTELTALRQRQEAEKAQQQRKAVELKARQEVERKDRLEAEQKAREEKLRLEAEAKAQREAERLAREEADRKTKELREAAELKERQEAEQKKQEAAELKAKQEADEKIRIETYIKDKYILTLLDNSNLRIAPDKNSAIVAKVNSDVSFKVTWITPDKQNVPWYQVSVSTGTTTMPAYIITTLAKLVTVQELNDHRLAQQKAAEEKARLEAEAKAKREAERLAKEEADRKAKELREAAELKERQETEQKKQEAAELKAKQEAEAKALEEEWLKDKYVVVQYKDTNIRQAPSKNTEIVQKAQAGQDFKIISRGKEWYKIALDTGTAYIHNTVVKVFLGTELTALRQQQEEARLEKLKKEAEEKALKEAQIIARLEAEQKTREEKLRLEAEQNAKAAAELKARQEAEEKARLETERKAKEAAEVKARIEAEAKAKMEAYVKDKYVVISDNNAVVRTAPNIRASVLHVAEENETFKLNWIRDNWYEIKVPSGTALVMGFVNVSAAKSMTMKELAAWQKVQEQERLLREAEEQKARQQAEFKAREEAAAKRAQLEAERLAKLEAEEKAREEAERKAREEAEAKALEEEWLKDKYIVVQYKNANVRQAPGKNAEIVHKAQAGQDFKIVSRGKEWYEIALTAGTAYIHNTVVKVLSGTELAALRQAQENEQKAKMEAAQKAAEEKATKAAESKAQQDEKARLEAGQKIKEVEQKAKAQEEREDLAEYGYVVINAPYAEIKIIPDTGAQALLISLKGDVFKYNGQQKGWYYVLTFSGETRFVRKSQCRGSNTAPQLPARESTRRDIYDILIDAKDRAMTETNAKYPSVKTQSELQEKIFYQQTVEEKLILEIFHKYKIQPATYLTLLSEAISKNW